MSNIDQATKLAFVAFDAPTKPQSQEQDIVEQHFALHQRIWDLSRKWRLHPEYLQETIDCCNAQIEMASAAAAAYRPLMHRAGLPQHWGYVTLSYVRESQGEYETAIQLCERARSEGWAGNWDERIQGIRQKIAEREKKQRQRSRKEKHHGDPAIC